MAQQTWKLETLEIGFKKGFSFEQTVDRYEGKIKFSNGDGESFTFNLDQIKCGEYIKLIAPEIVATANELSNKLLETLNLKSTHPNNSTDVVFTHPN